MPGPNARAECQGQMLGPNARAVHQQSIEAGLRRALEQGQFVLRYQPKINLRSGAIAGVEALIRWRHPEQGLLAPARFVSIAEACGLIQEIGRWVLREACLQARSWRQAGLPQVTIAVNASAPELHANNFLDNVRATLDEAGLAPSCLELELTESVLMRDVEASDSVLRGLRSGLSWRQHMVNTQFQSRGKIYLLPFFRLNLSKIQNKHSWAKT